MLTQHGQHVGLSGEVCPSQVFSALFFSFSHVAGVLHRAAQPGHLLRHLRSRPWTRCSLRVVAFGS